MKLEAVSFKRKLVWKQKDHKLEAFKDHRYELAIIDRKIHYKNGFASQQYKTIELAVEAAEKILNLD